MKKWLLLVLVAICWSCNKNTYEINGIFTTEDGTEIYLIDLERNDTLDIVETKDNKFHFSGDLEESFYAYVGYAKKRVRFILEQGLVTVDIDERVAYGTPTVDEYNLYHKKYYGFNAFRNEERKVLQAQKDAITAKEFNAQWAALDQKYLQKQADLADSVVCANPDNIMGALVMEDLALTDKERFLLRYEEVSEEVKNFSKVKVAYDNIILLANTAPGKMFTDYTVKGGKADGTDVKLSDYVGKGKYVLLDHWASWCGPCKAEMKYLKRAYEAFKDKNLEIVGIAVNDKREDTQQALQNLNLPWTQILDAKNLPKNVYGVMTIPHLILFAPDGTILMRGLRGEQILATLSEVLE